MKNLARIACVTIATLAVAGAATAPASANPAGQGQGTLTVKQFEDDLAQNAALAPEAKANYEKFVALPKAKKHKLISYVNEPTFLDKVISEMGQLSTANSAQEVKVAHDGDAVVTKTSTQENSFARGAEKGATTLAAERSIVSLSTHTH